MYSSLKQFLRYLISENKRVSPNEEEIVKALSRRDVNEIMVVNCLSTKSRNRLYYRAKKKDVKVKTVRQGNDTLVWRVA